MSMSELFALSAPWWHFVLRAAAIYVLVTVLMRVSGKRAVGQFTPFDLILLILIGNAVQNGINGGDNSLTGAFVMAVTLIVLNYVVAWGSARSVAFRHVVEGRATVLARDGKVLQDVLRRQLVSESDFRKAMRQSGCEREENIKLAILETNGHITIEMRDGRSG
jgi:uncharacterized membrane protein YcaP (DUF421 family)